MGDPPYVQWQKEYCQERYMEHLTIDELHRRAGDVLTNLNELTPDRKIAVRQVDGEGADWWRKWTHITAEFELRFGPYPAGWSSESLANWHYPKPEWPEVPSEYLALASRRDVLLKLGRRAHMEALLDQGQLRIAPASDYGDSSLNAAVHDDELSFESIARPGFRVMVSDRPEGPYIPVGGLRQARMKSTLPTDYFVYCMSYSARPRLFGDFAYDACVVITDPRAFVTRVETVVARVLPDYQRGLGRVRYADPHFDHGRLEIAMTKHFRFAYQCEFRMIWVPPNARKDLKPFFVTVGNLRDIATLITLPEEGISAA
jgi:hypothetical protein